MDKSILWLTNTEGGRYLLGIKEKDPIVDITPEGWHFYNGQHDNKHWYTARFHYKGYQIVFEKLMPALSKMEIAGEDSYESFLHFSALERKPRKYPSIYLATDTFNYINVNGSGRLRFTDNTYSTAHDAATAEQVFQNSYIMLHTDAAGTFDINRHYDPFNTSSLPDSAIISSAFLRYVANGTAEEDTDADNIVVVASTQASTTDLVTADYDQLGTTIFATFDVTNWVQTDNTNNDITFNATGLSNISLTGNTLLGTRMQRDVDNSAPTGGNRIDFKATTVLSVTYTVPGGNPMFFNPGGVTVG